MIAESHEGRGDTLRKAGQLAEAVEAYLAAAGAHELPPADLCLKLAQCYHRLGNEQETSRWVKGVVDAGHDYTAWTAAERLVRQPLAESRLTHRRKARVALLGSYTTTYLAPLLRLAAWRMGVALNLYECAFGQYRQEIADPCSGLYAHEPEFVILAVHEGDLGLPDHSRTPEDDVESELQRWTSLWATISQRCSARVVQHTFATPAEAPFGHLGARLPGARTTMIQALNARLGAAAEESVLLVDCERLSSLVGKIQWFDPRHWHLAKQAVAPGALPLLAQHTAAVVAADLGLGRKCLVLDLDNTLWGGVIGEDGLAGIKLGQGVEGEAFVAFQEYLLRLKNRGAILAVCSKNNEPDAREVFEHHPEMRLSLDDVAFFSCSWDDKPKQLRAIAQGLNIGLDSLIFVDDNPVERDIVRHLMPEVDVVPLPADPSGYVRALAQCLYLESSTYTPEDANRTEQYRARAVATAQMTSASSLEEFYRGLQMHAIVKPFDEVDLPRIAQLIGKSNQFNLTTRRYSPSQLRTMMADPEYLHCSLRLRDRFADHGLVSLLIARRKQDLLDINTWLMSCRVIGRTVEAELLKHVTRRALAIGCATLRGTYIPTAKNEQVKEIFARFGFALEQETPDGTTMWRYDLDENGPIENTFIDTVSDWETEHEQRNRRTCTISAPRAARRGVPDRLLRSESLAHG